MARICIATEMEELHAGTLNLIQYRNNTYGPSTDILQSPQRTSAAGIIGKAHMIAFRKTTTASEIQFSHEQIASFLLNQYVVGPQEPTKTKESSCHIRVFSTSRS